METVYRSIVMFLFLFIIVKILGKKHIKNLTLYDYVISITLGSIAADSILSLEYPLTDGIIALLVFGLFGYLISLLSYNNHKVEEIMDGEPIVLYKNDNFNYKNLEDAKFSIAKLLEFCRLKGCFDINELDCAVLEPSGDVSILLKEDKQPITSSDLNNESSKQALNYEVIVDGILNEKELKKAKLNKTWLKKFLKENNLKIEDVSLLEINHNRKTTLFTKENCK